MKLWKVYLTSCVAFTCLALTLLGQNPANPFTPQFYNGTAYNNVCSNGAQQYNPIVFSWSSCGPTGSWGIANIPYMVSILNQTGAITATTVFTAPANGVYSSYPTIHLVSSDKAGTITASYTCGSSSTNTYNPTVSAFPSGDSQNTVRVIYMNKGDICSTNLTAAGLTGTTYNLYFNVGIVGLTQ